MIIASILPMDLTVDIGRHDHVCHKFRLHETIHPLVLFTPTPTRLVLYSRLSLGCYCCGVRYNIRLHQYISLQVPGCYLGFEAPLIICLNGSTDQVHGALNSQHHH